MHDEGRCGKCTECKRQTLYQLIAEPGSPGHNWQTVLSALGWTFGSPMQEDVIAIEANGITRVEEIEILSARRLCGTNIAVIIPRSHLFPLTENHPELAPVYLAIRKRNPQGFILLTRRAFYRMDRDGFSFVGCYVQTPGARLELVTLSLTSSPCDLVNQAETGHANEHEEPEKDGVLAHVVNALDEGLRPADGVRYLRYMGTGSPWLLPYVDEISLAPYRI